MEIGLAIGPQVKALKLGRLVGNDSGFVTRRNPDSVRGPDISFYGYDQFPPGPMPSRCTDTVPRLVIEVLSPSDSWSDMLEKLSEYLRAGVTIACVVDPQTETVQVFYADRAPVTLSGEDELKLPEVLGAEFSVPAKRFFE
jgi:Uma2 family endonuclease